MSQTSREAASSRSLYCFEEYNWYRPISSVNRTFTGRAWSVGP